MATASFDRTFVVSDPKSQEKLSKFLESKEPAKTLSENLFSETERNRSEALLKQCLSHYKR